MENKEMQNKNVPIELDDEALDSVVGGIGIGSISQVPTPQVPTGGLGMNLGSAAPEWTPSKGLSSKENIDRLRAKLNLDLGD